VECFYRFEPYLDKLRQDSNQRDRTDGCGEQDHLPAPVGGMTAKVPMERAMPSLAISKMLFGRSRIVYNTDRR